MILDAWTDAGIDPRTIGYVEAHGTGTELGDPVEIDGLRKAFSHHGVTDGNVRVGSAKAHIGHTEGAASIAGVIKVILSMRHGELPAMPKFKELNPYIRLADSPLRINRETELWEGTTDGPRRAGVSSFGFGGTYAHAVIEEHEKGARGILRQAQEPGRAAECPAVVVLSARSGERLREYAKKMAVFLAAKDGRQATSGNPHAEQKCEEHPSIREDLIAILSDVLEMEPEVIDPDEDFDECLSDPIRRADFSERINEKHDVCLTPAMLAEHRSVTHLAGRLSSMADNGQRTTRLSSPKSADNEPSVYLLTGGAGGLGLIFATFLARKRNVRLMLTGRSALSQQTSAEIQALTDAGADICYHQADVSRREDVERLISETRSRFGRINGVIHSAGVIRDALILRKNPEDIRLVLALKIFGTIHLDEATASEPLDFFVLFSSITAVTGNPGQSDYAYANRFMDHFADIRENLRGEGSRSGKTLSLNWPLWQDGGMTVPQETQRLLAQRTGMIPLSRSEGLEAFANGLASDVPRVVVTTGDPRKIRQTLIPEHPPTDNGQRTTDHRKVAKGLGDTRFGDSESRRNGYRSA